MPLGSGTLGGALTGNAAAPDVFSAVKKNIQARLLDLAPNYVQTVKPVVAEGILQGPDQDAAYPAVLFAIERAERIGKPDVTRDVSDALFGHVTIGYRLRLWFGCYASGNGLTIGDAESAAWSAAAAVLQYLVGFTPAGPYLIPNAAVTPILPGEGEMLPFGVGPATYCVAVPAYVDILWRT